MSYAEDEVRRIAHVGFKRRARDATSACAASTRPTCSRPASYGAMSVIEVSAEYPDVALSHMYVDNAAMQLVRNPGQFDVVVTGNLFGDILSDQASMCVGSIGLLASASLGETQDRVRHQGALRADPRLGARHRRAGQGQPAGDDPLARHAAAPQPSAARRTPHGVEAAVARTLADGVKGADLGGSAGTAAIGEAVLERL
jgi:3-isopropylmalate dehydrogenase